MKGYTRTNGSADSRRPITLELLNSLVNCLPYICFSEFETYLFRSVFIIIFFAALRIIELVARKAGFQSGLQFSDVSCSDDQLIIFIS